MSNTDRSASPRVLLCYPSLLPGLKPTYGLQPLGILYIAALLRERGIAVEVLDADIEGLSCAEMAQRILAKAPDLVGFSVMTPQLFSALDTAALLKKERPHLPIVFGGAHVDSTHEDVLSMTEAIDCAVYGEGEYAMLDIADAFRRGAADGFARSVRRVPNVIVRDDEGRLVKNPARPFLPDLDVLPSVDYDMLGVERYRIPTASGRRVISMMLSRGCPFRCTFCDAPITMGKKIRFWSVPRVIADIRRYAEKYDCRDFVFKDSTFSANKKWAESFCDALIESGLRIQWRCNTRANLVPQPLLEKMKRAGCHIINFGVESGHPAILEKIEKEVSLAEVEDAHRRCRHLGIRTYATFMIGNPGENNQTVRATIQFARRIRPSLASFSICKAYPGTPLYEQAVGEGLVEPRWWARQGWDRSRHSEFEARWQLTDHGALALAGFDSQYWQRRATRAFYLRPYFAFDTARSMLSDPHLLRHVITLGKELLPNWKLPWAARFDRTPAENCPSTPQLRYGPRQTESGGGV